MKMNEEYVAVARPIPMSGTPLGTTTGQTTTPTGTQTGAPNGTPVNPINSSSNGTIPFKGIVPKEKEINKEREDDEEAAWWTD